MRKQLALFIVLSISLCLASAQADGLSDFYQPLLNKGILWEEAFSFFSIDEYGLHGSAAYNEFDSKATYSLLNTQLTFPILNNLEVTVGLNHSLPAQFKRNTYTTGGNLSTVQRYKIDFFREYALAARLRNEPFEFFISILEKNQKTNWTSLLYPADPSYFSYIRAHYEDFTAGMRFLTSSQDMQSPSALSSYTQPLVNPQQALILTQLEYRKGVVRRNTPYYGGANFLYINFYHRLKEHVTPTIEARFGLLRQLELESGISFTSPFEYTYEYKDEDITGITQLYGEYSIDNNFNIPLKLRWRPQENLELALFSSCTFMNQELEYWSKTAAGVRTDYSNRGLSYQNYRPGLELSYLFDQKKQVLNDEFSQVTKKLLRKGQVFAHARYYRDITSLDKSETNGPQNVIDPYNVFQYPLDYFVAGTEFATYFLGNSSASAAEVKPQNYHFIQAGLTYGLTDKINLGCKAGYRSGSHLHHFAIGDPRSAFSLRTRFYKFKPFYFFDLTTDMRLTPTSLISLAWHYVPEYTTIMQIQGRPKEFRADDSYYSLTAQLKILF
ncbi:MAG: hypothetical protein KBA46_04215 [Candidatus Omnitrophica bacterium]|nr:hypothetical protein [Candidatus Omnitrophota bacterium]